jgi:hypothetical protein
VLQASEAMDQSVWGVQERKATPFIELTWKHGRAVGISTRLERSSVSVYNTRVCVPGHKIGARIFSVGLLKVDAMSRTSSAPASVYEATTALWWHPSPSC